MSSPNQTTLGAIEIRRVPEMEIPFLTAQELFTDATHDAVDAERHWMEPWALCPSSGRLIIAVQSYLVRTSRHTILIDTCVGCDKSNEFYEPASTKDVTFSNETE